MEEANLSSHPGDTLVCYSDGVTDAARRHDNKMYGLDRLKTIVRNEGHRPAQELLETIVSDVDKFKGDAEQTDDLTLLVTKAL